MKNNKKTALQFTDKEMQLKLKPIKTFGDSMHGSVQLNKLEVAIVDTEDFQRLRGIKQLGSTYLVYPSANHTRFEHSIGTLYMANIIINKIKNNPHNNDEEKDIQYDEEQIIRLMALLHDIGHMSFGHTLEDEANLFVSHDSKKSVRWEYFIGDKSPIGKLIIEEWGIDFFKRFYRLIICKNNFTGFESDAFMYDIVSNTVCADLLDYLKRDSLNTGLKLPSNNRFLDYIYIHKYKTGERRIAIRLHKSNRHDIRSDIISELEQLLTNRYYLGERVYFHRVKLITGAMISGSMLRAIKANRLYLWDINKRKNSNELVSENISKDEFGSSIFNVQLFSDSELLNYLSTLSKKYLGGASTLSIKAESYSEQYRYAASRLADLFKKRRIYKQLEIYEPPYFETEYKNLLKIDTDDIEKIGNIYLVNLHKNLIENPLTRLEIEDRICEYLELCSGDFLIYCPGFKMSMKLAKVRVLGKGSNVPIELGEFNENGIDDDCKNINLKHTRLWKVRIFVNPECYNFLIDHTVKELIDFYIKWNFKLDKEAESIFYEKFTDYRIKKLKEKAELDSSYYPKKEDIEMISKTLVEITYSNRSLKDIDRIIKEYISKNSHDSEILNF